MESVDTQGGVVVTEIDTKELWQNVLVEIELSISKPNFTTWFKDTSIARIEDGIVYLSVPNQFVRDWLSKKYHKFVLKALRSASSHIRGLEYTISRAGSRRAEGEDAPRPIVSMTGELPLSEYYISKSDNLNPRYTFDSFVVGPFNELAFAAAQAVVKKPGIAYNPLFIYGATGRGKTHLIQAIGNQIKKANPAKKIYYVTSEKFVMDYLAAVQSANFNGFKDKYRQYDVLIMDDVQFISQKERSMDELFHTFNVLHDNNKQIVFSSDKHPSQLQHMDDRLKSRFSGGMIVDIPEPDFESRMAILKTKALQQGFLLGDDLIQYLAETIVGNIRELEGTLNAVVCQSQLKGRALNLAEVKNLIKLASRPKKLVSTKEIIKKIADFYDIEEESIHEKTRRKEVVRPRQVIMYILREDFHVSFPTIGSRLGGRDHTTVIHSCEKVKNDLKVDATLAQEIEQIRSMLK